MAVDGDRIKGMGGYRRLDSRSVELTRLRVANESRRTGVGRQLLQALTESARQAGYKQMVLDLAHEMEAARRLVVSEGFDMDRQGEFFGTRLYFYKKIL